MALKSKWSSAPAIVRVTDLSVFPWPLAVFVKVKVSEKTPAPSELALALIETVTGVEAFAFSAREVAERVVQGCPPAAVHVSPSSPLFVTVKVTLVGVKGP